MPLDLRTGFDARARAEIMKVLPSGDATARTAAFKAIEWAALFYCSPSRARTEYKRREKLLDDLDQLARDLNAERRSVLYGDDGAAARRACAALYAVREQVARRLDLYTLVRRHGHDLRRDILYGELLRIWSEVVGGKRPPTSRAGPCARYLITTVYEITGRLLTPDAVVTIVRKWYAPKSSR
jgi:hypothetical protein